jgi:hypothetical protein
VQDFAAAELGWAGLGLLLQGLMIRPGKNTRPARRSETSPGQPGGGPIPYTVPAQHASASPGLPHLGHFCHIVTRLESILYCTVLYMYLAGCLGRYGAPGPLGPNKQAVGTAPVFNLLNVDLWVDGMVGRLDGWMDGWCISSSITHAIHHVQS